MKKVKHETLWSNLEKSFFYKIFAAKLVCNVCVLSTLKWRIHYTTEMKEGKSRRGTIYLRNLELKIL